MITQTLDFNNIERKIFWALTACIGAVLGFSLYSVLALTVAGVDRDHFSRATHDLSTKAGDIEAEYLSVSNSITLAHAEELGFHEVNAKFTATTPAPAKLSIAR
ncbi:MAG: hypothetical protein HZB12_03420 [Candidatus Yonathbacteria bacterium]|nr:hypothetical protein [Candidatus Yonathbacteria bacterium]